MTVVTGVLPSAAMLMARAVIFRPVAICPAAAADSVTMASAVSLTRYAVRPAFITWTICRSFLSTRLL